MRKLNIQKAFISATAVHVECGLSIYTGEFIAFKQAMVEIAQTTYAVIDHYKFGQIALCTFAALSEISMIMTDSGLSAETHDVFRRAGVNINKA